MRTSVAHPKTAKQQKLFFLGMISLFIISMLALQFDTELFLKGCQRIPTTLAKLFQISFKDSGYILSNLLETLCISLITMALSMVFGVAFAFFIAKNTTPFPIFAKLLRTFFVIIRTIPMQVWVLLAVASVGFGSMAGIMGMLLPTISYLAKNFADQIELSGIQVKEAMQSTGANWLMMILKGYAPICKTMLLASAAFRFEISVSESTVLGLVGAGGIGMLISKFIKYYQFDSLSLCLILVFLVSFFLELTTNTIRKQMRKR